MKKALVIIPTYNEIETLPRVIESVLKQPGGFDVLVIDDASPDGTASVIGEIMKREKRVFLIERTGKLGLGTAYITGFKWGLARGYDFFVEMDADGSHDPEALPSLIGEMEKGYGLVIGSRYLHETISVVGWDFRRLMLSKFGNFYAAWILGVKVTDLTSGYRCYSRKALESLDLEGVHSSGYGFQIEMAYRIARAGLRVGEMPIIFYERTSGSSKMSHAIVREALVLPWRLRLGRIIGAGGQNMPGDFSYNARTILGFLLVVSGTAGALRLGWWLSTEGDIVDLIHRAKLGLPDWAWAALKIGLSAFSGLLFLALVLTLAIMIFAAARRK
jgi:dolichol-phosphate mannosyltransferase